MNIKDDVNSPDHYTHGGIETYEYVYAKLGKQGFIDYCYGNVFKYVSRAKYKGTEIKDLRKTMWYIEKIIQVLEDRMLKNEP